MTLTLLLDLDDTLLGNPLDIFLPAYLKALAKRMAVFIDPGKMVPMLLSATKQMTQGGQADRRLEETFSAAFYPPLGLDAQAVRPTLEAFYAEDFPLLQPLTYRRPEAKQLVDSALKRGYRVAIATSPLFPRTAILQRLAWAGLPIEQYPFALVSSYETFHFAKPDPAFFAEFLGQLGWPAGPVLMVGDDIASDVLACRELGLPVFWMPSNPDKAWDQPGPPPPRGGLSDVLPWLDSQPEASLLPDFNHPAALQTILRATPASLAALCDRLAPEQWGLRSTSNEWSPVEIICHLRDVENEVNLPRLDLIQRENNPFIAGQDTDRWANERTYLCQDLPSALQSFNLHRSRLLADLSRQSPIDWQRPIRHAIFGPTNLQELVRIITEHDRIHIQQLFQTLDAATKAVNSTAP